MCIENGSLVSLITGNYMVWVEEKTVLTSTVMDDITMITALEITVLFANHMHTQCENPNPNPNTPQSFTLNGN